MCRVDINFFERSCFFTETTSTLATYLANIGTVFTALTGWTGEIITLVMDNPVLLVSVTIGFAFVAVGLFKSLRG